MKSNTQNAKIEAITEKTLVLGIDVGSETHYARAFDYRGIEYSKKPFKFSNTEAGFVTFKEWILDLKERHEKDKVVPGMEPIGHYWFNLGKFLQDNEMKPVLVNPHHVKKSKELDDNNPTKNDRKDPKVIAGLVREGRYMIPYLPEGVYARDLILTIIGQVGANGCNYQVMEFTGEGAKTLSISDRIALCNMAVEAGAKTGIFEADEKAMEYLKEHGREPKAVFHSDPDAHYIREYTIDLSKVEPVVAKPDFVDNLSPAKEVRGIKIDEAFLGSCNNGRIEDLRVGAEVIKGKKVADKVRFLVVPASQTIYRQALKEGLLDIFMEAGAIVMNPNCSVCWGSCQGVIGENEVLISTGTRNFKGRAGHPSSKVYLGSAATVTASAIKGEIALASDL